jgi:hypothetical protein
LTGLVQGLLGGNGPTGSQLTAAPRAALVFVSRLRNDPNVRSNCVRHYGTAPGTWLMSSIAMALNPNSVKWVQNKRINKKDTREGSVYFHFTNSKGQNNDILTLSFNGNTGNLDLRGATLTQPIASPEATAGPDTGALYKLQVWQNLYLMSREPVMLDDRKSNVFTLTYSSALFPLPINFTGFFAKVLEFEETAMKPNSRNYSFDFTVTSSSPSLDEVLWLMSAYLSAPPQEVAVPQFVNPVSGNLIVTGGGEGDEAG